ATPSGPHDSFLPSRSLCSIFSLRTASARSTGAQGAAPPSSERRAGCRRWPPTAAAQGESARRGLRWARSPTGSDGDLDASREHGGRAVLRHTVCRGKHHDHSSRHKKDLFGVTSCRPDKFHLARGGGRRGVPLPLFVYRFWLLQDADTGGIVASCSKY
ncbi:unnamed protein product, partial [Urochloa humidicola]